MLNDQKYASGVKITKFKMSPPFFFIFPPP